jgi:hypothetical protein
MTTDARAEDMVSLDRDVGGAWRALVKWRGALAEDPIGQAEEDPIEAVRRVAGKSTWDELVQMTPSVADVPLRDALVRWVYVLTQARIGRPDEVALARLESKPSESRRALGPPKSHTPAASNWRTAWRGVVAARTPGEAALSLEAAASRGPAIAEAARAGAGRRVEVARRFGFEHPWQPTSPVSPGALRGAASRLLDATDEVSQAVWKDAVGASGGVAAVLHAAVGREAGEGWPARLTGWWLEEAFGAGPHGLPIDLPRLPEVYGATSFARALAAFGLAIRRAAAPASMPFSIAHDPAFVGAHRFAFLFGALASDPAWQARVLGVGRRAALGQARVLARSALLEARLHAARILLGDDVAPASLGRFEEIGVRLFGAELDRRLWGAWPRARYDEPARLVALLEARPLAEGLRDQFDSDWDRNPRAWGHLRALGSGPAREAIAAETLDAHVSGLARAFEEALG